MHAVARKMFCAGAIALAVSGGGMLESSRRATAADAPTLPADSAATVAEGDAIRSAKRVLVIGDSITFAGGWVATLSAWMEEQGLTASLINAALPSETASGLSEDGHAGGAFPRPDVHERLDRVLRLVRPDLVLACYGMNCGIYQPLDETRFAAYRDGIERLHEKCEAAGATVIHLTPPTYDGRPNRDHPAGDVDYEAVLAAYSSWLLGKRDDGWLVIDVHTPMLEALEARRQEDANFTFQPDAVHPDDAGQRVIAEAVLAGLGASPESTTETALEPFLPETTARMRLLRDAYLAAAGHLRPGMADGLPLADAEARASSLTDSLRARRRQLRGTKHPGGEWRIALEWPRPPVVTPGPAPSEPASVPSDAVALFDGTSLDAWEGAEAWKVADGVATVGGGAIRTKQSFGDCQLHVEFRTPSPATGSGQGRGNSGVFLMGLYEIQVLDSFEDGTEGPLTYPDGQCGALYKQQPPMVNACRAPGEWQTYDILFTRPRFAEDGSLERAGRVSVLHNGISIHADTEILGPTAWHKPPQTVAHEAALPITIQDHGNPVAFRSIWIRPLEPIQPTETPRPTFN
ncbi:MAG: family 16 glycoside hydrolase [Pirellulales bacterium]